MYDMNDTDTAPRTPLTRSAIEARAHLARSRAAHDMLRALRRALVGGR